jgi:peroxiredoxin
MGYFDLFDDGQQVVNDKLSYRMDPSPIFLRLPKDGTAVQNGWDNVSEVSGERATFTFSKDESTKDLFSFEQVLESPLLKVNLVTHKSKIKFDCNRCIIRKIAVDILQNFPLKRTETGGTEFQSVKEHDAKWMKKFGEETELYFKASEAYEDLIGKACKDSKHCEELLNDAVLTLIATHKALTLPILHEQIDAQLKYHPELTKNTAAHAQSFAKAVGEPAPTWEATDFDGKDHSQADYKDKVVVLMFWSRSSDWCIRAMPQIAQLAKDFKNEPVAVLGMNTDRDEKNGKFVVDVLKLTFPNLKGQDLPEKLKSMHFLAIIDQEGNVYDIHENYTSSLREKVSKSVKELLAKKKWGWLGKDRRCAALS